MDLIANHGPKIINMFDATYLSQQESSYTQTFQSSVDITIKLQGKINGELRGFFNLHDSARLGYYHGLISESFNIWCGQFASSLSQSINSTMTISPPDLQRRKLTLHPCDWVHQYSYFHLNDNDHYLEALFSFHQRDEQ